MEAFNLFIAILLGGVGYSNSLFLVLLQTFGSAFLALRTLFESMRRRSPLLKVIASLIPMVIGCTYIIAASITFGAFFSSAWSDQELLWLVEGTITRDFVYEVLGWVALFLVLMLVYTFVYRLKPGAFFLNFTLELAAAVALLVLYGGLLIDDFPFTIWHLCFANIGLVRLPIYGLFAIIFKIFVLICALVIGGLLYEKPYDRQEEPSPDDYWNRQSFLEKQAQQYLTRDYLPLGVALFLFGASVFVFFGWIFWYEYGGWPDFDDLSGDEQTGMIFLLFIMLLVLAYCLVGLLMVARRLAPQTSRMYRQLMAIGQQLGDDMAVLELFYAEVIIPHWQNPEADRWQLGTSRVLSPHFEIEKKGLRTQLRWRGGSLPEKPI